MASIVKRFRILKMMRNRSQSQENQQEVDSLANLNPERQHVFYDRNPEFTTTHKDQYCNNLTPT